MKARTAPLLLAPAWACVVCAAMAAGCGTDDGGPPGGSGGAAGSEGSSSPLDALDDLAVHLNLGDSVGAGYNASGENSNGGRGYARLLYENHPDYPELAGANVVALHPNAEFADRAKSGATSTDVVGQAVLIPTTNGDVLATIYVAGNDFNDDLATILDPARTDIAVDAWVENMTTVVGTLREAYDRPERGQDLVITIATIHEPTDAMLSIPPQYTERFCGQLQQLQKLGDDVKQTVWGNLNRFNDRIRSFARDFDLVLVDSQELFVGHGLNADPADQWIDVDCTHFNDTGHHELRRAVWSLLTEPR